MATIMIVEDETVLLQTITKKLKINGIDTISCASGEQALDYLNELVELPDLIWLDYHLQGMNGLEFMHEVKEIKNLPNIPIVIVSNSANEQQVHSMLTLGAESYVLKAKHSLQDIVEHVHQYINTKSKEPLNEISEKSL